MRDDWVTTREARAMLGNISKARVSQLMKTGELTGEKDANGVFKIWRYSVEARREYMTDKAARTVEERAKRKSMQAEAAEEARIDRMRKERERAAKEKAEADYKTELLKTLQSIARSAEKIAKGI